MFYFAHHNGAHWLTYLIIQNKRHHEPNQDYYFMFLQKQCILLVQYPYGLWIQSIVIGEIVQCESIGSIDLIQLFLSQPWHHDWSKRGHLFCSPEFTPEKSRVMVAFRILSANCWSVQPTSSHQVKRSSTYHSVCNTDTGTVIWHDAKNEWNEDFILLRTFFVFFSEKSCICSICR